MTNEEPRFVPLNQPPTHHYSGEKVVDRESAANLNELFGLDYNQLSSIEQRAVDKKTKKDYEELKKIFGPLGGMEKLTYIDKDKRIYKYEQANWTADVETNDAHVRSTLIMAVKTGLVDKKDVALLDEEGKKQEEFLKKTWRKDRGYLFEYPREDEISDEISKPTYKPKKTKETQTKVSDSTATEEPQQEVGKARTPEQESEEVHKEEAERGDTREPRTNYPRTPQPEIPKEPEDVLKVEVPSEKGAPSEPGEETSFYEQHKVLIDERYNSEEGFNRVVRAAGESNSEYVTETLGNEDWKDKPNEVFIGALATDLAEADRRLEPNEEELHIAMLALAFEQTKIIQSQKEGPGEPAGLDDDSIIAQVLPETDSQDGPGEEAERALKEAERDAQADPELVKFQKEFDEEYEPNTVDRERVSAFHNKFEEILNIYTKIPTSAQNELKHELAEALKKTIQKNEDEKQVIAIGWEESMVKLEREFLTAKTESDQKQSLEKIMIIVEYTKNLGLIEAHQLFEIKHEKLAEQMEDTK